MNLTPDFHLTLCREVYSVRIQRPMSGCIGKKVRVKVYFSLMTEKTSTGFNHNVSFIFIHAGYQTTKQIKEYSDSNHRYDNKKGKKNLLHIL